MKLSNGEFRLVCNSCGKPVSTPYIPILVPEYETPDRDLIIRAYIECPDCIKLRTENESNNTTSSR